MEPDKMLDIVLENQRSLTAFDKWASSIDKRVETLEKSSTTLMNVQLALERLASANANVGEKISDMKQLLENIVAANKTEHEMLNERLKKLEDAPGEKWNKAVWIIITAALMAASAGLTKLFAP